MAVARPRRLTTVATEPMLLPMNAPTAPVEQVAKAAVFTAAPRVVVTEPVESLSDARLRPRRVIVVK